MAWKQNKTKVFVPKILSSERKRLGSILGVVSKTNISDLVWNESRKTKAFDYAKLLVDIKTTASQNVY
jgi:hypothetical protein